MSRLKAVSSTVRRRLGSFLMVFAFAISALCASPAKADVASEILSLDGYGSTVSEANDGCIGILTSDVPNYLVHVRHGLLVIELAKSRRLLVEWHAVAAHVERDHTIIPVG